MFGLQSLNQWLSTCMRFRPFSIMYISLKKDNSEKRETYRLSVQLAVLYTPPQIPYGLHMDSINPPGLHLDSIRKDFNP